MKKKIALATAAASLLSIGAQADNLLAYTMLGTGAQVRNTAQQQVAPAKAKPTPSSPDLADDTDKSGQSSCGGQGGESSCGASGASGATGMTGATGDKSGQGSCGAGTQSQ